ncbi:MAG: hypothetical protein K5655_04195 [Lachnospiraceae bacterium]|nr:hypothetical protein [Lachnospiraceae bacterium]
MTVTELNQAIITLINQAELPFDAKVFVLRSIHTEMEQKYTLLKQQMQSRENESATMDPETEQGGN